MSDRKFSHGERIAVTTPGRFSKVVHGHVTGGDDQFVHYTGDDGKARKTRRGAIHSGNPTPVQPPVE